MILVAEMTCIMANWQKRFMADKNQTMQKAVRLVQAWSQSWGSWYTLTLSQAPSVDGASLRKRARPPCGRFHPGLLPLSIRLKCGPLWVKVGNNISAHNALNCISLSLSLSLSVLSLSISMKLLLMYNCGNEQLGLSCTQLMHLGLPPFVHSIEVFKHVFHKC